MSTITIPAKGYASQALITLATQARADILALEGGGGGSITFDDVAAALAVADTTVDMNGEGFSSLGTLDFAADSTTAGLAQAQHESAAGATMTIQAQQGASGFNGGALLLMSGAAGSASDLPGAVRLDMGFSNGQGGGLHITAGSEGDLVSFNASGSGGVNAVFSGTGSILATPTSLSLAWEGTPRVRINNAGLGFFNTTPAGKQTVTGSRADPEAALASLLTSLATLGLITDSTTES